VNINYRDQRNLSSLFYDAEGLEVPKPFDILAPSNDFLVSQKSFDGYKHPGV